MRVVLSQYPSKGSHIPLLSVHLGSELRVVLLRIAFTKTPRVLLSLDGQYSQRD